MILILLPKNMVLTSKDGLAAEGYTTVEDIQYIERGYEDFHIKLQGLGAQIEALETEKDFRKFQLKTG